ncbi:MAG: AMP-binding protein [Pseudomonadales bacterium]|jgi:fatty-acyl-CoA synthase|nr:AMP-binding protein [Pseudomonadales bacterium]
MYPGHWAKVTPEKAAVINARTGETLSYAELDAASNRIANWLADRGMVPGDHVALYMENNLRFFEIAWAAFRSGLYLTCINRYLTAEEAAYIVDDCHARVVFSSQARAEVATALPGLCPAVEHWLMSDGAIAGWQPLEDAVADSPVVARGNEPAGDSMLYSSGTTGRPKGIKRPLSGESIRAGMRISAVLETLYRFTQDSVYLSPAPLYHAAPFAYCMGTHSLGGTIVMMEKFDPVEALRLIEQHRITHSQWVPTMFVRMLKLDAATRQAFDVSSLQVAIHAAAPCPVEVKRQMIEWWGPVLYEYYAGTEANGSTFITSEEWLEHPGSVGRAASGVIHICDEAGRELPAGESGLIYFEQEVVPFEYHRAPEKTAEARHPEHPNWTALGDVGYVDEEGYLYLTDRKAFMIISGGVNVYPQQVEDALVLHPKVADVAVFGIPNEDLGEEVKAVVEAAAGVVPDDALAAELLAYAREHLAGYMIPKSIDFIDEMPRLPTGKLYKRILRDGYLGKTDSRIV